MPSFFFFLDVVPWATGDNPCDHILHIPHIFIVIIPEIGWSLGPPPLLYRPWFPSTGSPCPFLQGGIKGGRRRKTNRQHNHVNLVFLSNRTKTTARQKEIFVRPSGHGNRRGRGILRLPVLVFITVHLPPH